MSASCVLPIVNLYSTNKSLGSSSSNIVNNKSNNYEQPFVKIQTSDTCEEEWGDSIWSTNNNQVGEMELKIFNNNYKNTNITGNHILNNNNNKKTRDFHFVSSRIARRHLRQSRSSNQVGHRAPTLNNLLTLSVLTNDSNNNECKSRRCSLSSVCSNWSSAFSTPRKTPRDNQLFGYDMKCLCHPPDNELASNNMHVSGPQILHPSIFEGTNEFPNLFQEVKDALLNGGSIKLAEEGEGGTYFVKEKNGKPIAVFKPFDEEPGACNNPRGNVSPPMIGDIMAGTSWLREIAAHCLDHGSFSGVPETLGVVLPSTLGAFKKDKTGSLQRFVVPKNGEGKMVPAADLTPGKFSVDDVHRIGILDLRLCNCDRHGGNLLAHVNTNETTRLVPIDHGFVLPLTLRDLDFEWLWFPQASVPFSSNSLNYISRLNEDKDVSRLIELGIERKAVNLCKAATITLKMCAKSGWCLRRIGELLRPESLTDESPIETALIKSTKEEDEVDWEEFKIKLATLIQEFPVTK